MDTRKSTVLNQAGEMAPQDTEIDSFSFETIHRLDIMPETPQIFLCAFASLR